MGSIYKRGKVYGTQYYRNGKLYQETTKSHKEVDAKRLLKKREGEISDGKLPGIYLDRVKFDELAGGFSWIVVSTKRSHLIRRKGASIILKSILKDIPYLRLQPRIFRLILSIE